MDISQSRVQALVLAGAGYNLGASKLSIKGIRADAAGLVEIIDEDNNTIPYNCLQGEVLPVQGKIQITATTAVTVQVLL